MQWLILMHQTRERNKTKRLQTFKIILYCKLSITASMVQGQRAAFGTQVRGFKPGRSRRIFRAKKILSTPSFGGEVKPSVPCRRFSACQGSLHLRGSRNLGKITGQFLAHNSTFRGQDLSRLCGRTGTWGRKWERLKAGESKGKLPPRTCPGCSVPEPYRSLNETCCGPSRGHPQGGALKRILQKFLN